ncbi:hypothetical protein L1987_32683 [Smallanthus sonchifolius]|uniref:Uncharacterized protein n=1 Tax=Smallanthus sonchifolius TaxID=185202 RepID=A0ACB9HQA8_9ASTR|nr:hypothetical protein L1987_32683 [Smallanthus sonchifolius]
MVVRRGESLLEHVPSHNFNSENLKQNVNEIEINNPEFKTIIPQIQYYDFKIHQKYREIGYRIQTTIISIYLQSQRSLKHDPISIRDGTKGSSRALRSPEFDHLT